LICLIWHMFTTTDQKVSGLNPDGVTKRRITRSESCGFSFLEPLGVSFRVVPKKKSAARRCCEVFVSEFGAKERGALQKVSLKINKLGRFGDLSFFR